MHRRSVVELGLSALTFVLASVSAGQGTAWACMAAPPEHHWVRIAEESAVITYDSATKTEHFIRRASFESDVADFGFLVPVPTKPTLTEADPAIFERIEGLTRPKLVYTHHVSGIDPMPLVLSMFLLRSSKSEAIPLASQVHVLDEVTVAGYDAVVLEASSATALADWLTQHGYAKGPEVLEWVAPYVEKKWLLTAFRIAPKDAGSSAAKHIGSGTVDIAFQTDAPFYPYREPASMRTGAKTSRSLAVYFFGAERVKGVLGEKASWAGSETFAKRLDVDVAGVPGGTSGKVLSAFVDRSSPRPGTDEVFFRRADSQDERIPPPIEIAIADKIPVPIDVVLLLGIPLFFLGRAIRKRREGDGSK